MTFGAYAFLHLLFFEVLFCISAVVFVRFPFFSCSHMWMFRFLFFFFTFSSWKIHPAKCEHQPKKLNGKDCIQNMHERKIIEENCDVKWKFSETDEEIGILCSHTRTQIPLIRMPSIPASPPVNQPSNQPTSKQTYTRHSAKTLFSYSVKDNEPRFILSNSLCALKLCTEVAFIIQIWVESV